MKVYVHRTYSIIYVTYVQNVQHCEQPRVNLCVLKRYIGVCLYIVHTAHCGYRSVVVPATLSLSHSVRDR
jgi:hypothetical protein